ncbi:MAG: hypothetical protein KUG79_17850 [Pseudomonadales bacterium]|nr:hypothetical protein [Pseudomonadales bacterium]
MRCEFCRIEVLKENKLLGTPISIHRIGAVHHGCADLEICTICDEALLEDTDLKGWPLRNEGYGYVHSICAEQDVANRVTKRVFGSTIKLCGISKNDLLELKELVQQELNARDGVNTDVELF